MSLKLCTRQKIRNIFGVLIVAQSGTIYRLGERLRLHQLLDKENLNLTLKQKESIFRVLSEPESTADILPEWSGSLADKIVDVFKESFNFGFQIAIFFPLFLTIILFLLMLLALYKGKAGYRKIVK